jgi:hypothetical protein
VDIGSHEPLVVAGGQDAAGQLVEPELLGSAQLDDAVHRRMHYKVCQRGGDVVCGLRLHERRRQADHFPVTARIGDPADELEELRRTQNRVRHASCLHELLLGDLCAEVAALREAVGAHNGQGNVMAHTGDGFRRQHVPGRRLEELHYRRVVPRGSVRDVDDDLRILERLGEPFSRDRVHAGVRRGRERLVARVAELVDELRPDQAGPADDDDLHLVLLRLACC